LFFFNLVKVVNNLIKFVKVNKTPLFASASTNAMESRRSKAFLYDLSENAGFKTPPRNSTLNSKKSPTVETRHDRSKRNREDRYETQPFYPFPGKGQSSLEVVPESIPNSQEEPGATGSSPILGEVSKKRRVASKLTYKESPLNEGGGKTSGADGNHIDLQIQMYKSNIRENKRRIEEIELKCHESTGWIKFHEDQVKALKDQIKDHEDKIKMHKDKLYSDETLIMNVKRTIAQLKNRKEDILVREFERKHD
jgi:hypothetical protein